MAVKVCGLFLLAWTVCLQTPVLEAIFCVTKTGALQNLRLRIEHEVDASVRCKHFARAASASVPVPVWNHQNKEFDVTFTFDANDDIAATKYAWLYVYTNYLGQVTTNRVCYYKKRWYCETPANHNGATECVGVVVTDWVKNSIEDGTRQTKVRIDLNCPEGGCQSDVIRYVYLVAHFEKNQC